MAGRLLPAFGSFLHCHSGGFTAVRGLAKGIADNQEINPPSN